MLLESRLFNFIWYHSTVTYLVRRSIVICYRMGGPTIRNIMLVLSLLLNYRRRNIMVVLSSSISQRGGILWWSYDYWSDGGNCGSFIIINKSNEAWSHRPSPQSKTLMTKWFLHFKPLTTISPSSWPKILFQSPILSRFETVVIPILWGNLNFVHISVSNISIVVADIHLSIIHNIFKLVHHNFSYLITTQS